MLRLDQDYETVWICPDGQDLKIPADPEERYQIRFLPVFVASELQTDEAILDHLLVSWEGIIGKNGKPIACTEKSRRSWYAGFPDRFFWLMRKAMDPITFVGDLGERAKNSKGPSVGS